MFRLLSAIFLIFISQYAYANTQLHCVSKNYSVQTKYGTYENAKRIVPEYHSHTIIDDQIIFKINDKNISQAEIIKNDNKIQTKYKIGSKYLKLIYFKKTKKFNIQIIVKGHHPFGQGSVWGTCEISTSNTKNKNLIASKSEIKKQINLTKQIKQEKQKLAQANIQLKCVTEDYRINNRKLEYTTEWAKSWVPLKHTHLITDNNVTFKTKNKIIKQSLVNYLNNKIQANYKFKSGSSTGNDLNLKFTYFRKSKKFNIEFGVTDFYGTSPGDVWGTCEISNSNTQNKNLIVSKSEIKNTISSGNFEHQKQNRTKLENKLAEEKVKREAEQKAKKLVEEKARLESEQKARLLAEEKAKRVAEQKARLLSEEKAKREAETSKRLAAEEKKKRLNEERLRLEAEKQRLTEEQKRIDLEMKVAILSRKNKVNVDKLVDDKIAPVISAISKQDGFYTTISGTINDDVKLAEVLINNKLVTPQSDGSFTTKLYVPRNGLEVKIIAFDMKGNKSTKKLNIERGAIEEVSGFVFASLDPSAKKVKSNRNALALIVGVAKYEKTNADAIYADKDARQFYDYARMKLGIPAENIKELINQKADRIEITLAVKDWIARSTKRGKTDIYLYFAGHGLASDDGKDMYLLPYDGLPRLLQESALKRDQLFLNIKQAKPRSVTVFLDTCYSGTTRGTDMLISSRPITIRAIEQSIPNNFTLFSAAAGDQTSKPLEEAKHGMFSYFLMKGMEGDADANNDNKITARELHAYVEQNVVQQSSGSQTPELQGDKERVLVQFN